MGTYRAWFQSLAVFLLVGGPLPAQAQEEQPLKMVYAVFVQDTTGKVVVSQRHSKAGGSDRAMQASQTIDTAIARLSALPPNAADSVSAYAPRSGPASHLSEKDLKKVVSMLGPGESAVLIISPKPDVSEVQKFMGMGGQGTPEVVVVDMILDIKE